MENPKVQVNRYINVDGKLYDGPQWNYEDIERASKEFSDRVASLRKGIEDVLDLHGEDFIKERLRQLLRVV